MISLKWSVVLCGLALLAFGKAEKRPLTSVVDPPLIAPAFEVEESEIVAIQEINEAYRLPKTSVPTHYDLKLSTEVHNGEKIFSGTVAIHLTVVEATNTIVLHHRNLTIGSAELKIVPSEGADPELLDAPTSADTSAVEQLTFTSATQLNTGEYILTVPFTGVLSDNQDGFYISSYVNADGDTKYLATTQFEATSARMAFPCYDEPGLKATFALQITHGANYTANSNMPYTTVVDGETAVTTFETSPKMSTYLLAFVVSDFEFKGTDTYSVWARGNAIDEVDFAVEAGEKILAELDAHLGIGYYEHMPAMKQFAIPDFSAGAMENWGLVTYREQYLLFNPELSTYRTKTYIATIIAHEFAHQWFGNLVTPAWWEYLWLNEGFATLYEYYAAHLAYPDVGYWDLFNPLVIQSALVPDGLETTRPMTWSADTPTSISNLFDRVAYPKSGSVLNMMRHVLGDDNWAAGLNAYLTARQFDGVTAEHLSTGLQSAVEGKDVLPDGVTVKDIMDTWTTEAGYPVLSVRRTYKTGDVIISQERFISDRKVPNTNVWMIPYNYATQSTGNFDDLNTYSWLSTKAARINTAATADEWIVFNQQQVGFYRVNYDEQNWELITNALLSNHESIHRLNRAQIIDDAYWLARSGRLDLQVLMKLLPYLLNETEYAPWTAASTVLTYFNGKLRGTESYENFKILVNHLISKLYATLDVDSVSETETLIHKYLKQTITSWACLIGNEDCLQKTKDALQVEVDGGGLVHPDIATVVYCYGLRTADKNVYQYLYQRIYPTQNWAFRSMVITALGCSENKEFLKSLLASAVAGNSVEINYKSSERTQIVQAVYSGGRTGVDALIEFLRDSDRLQEFVARLDVSTLSSTLKNIASRTNNQDELDLLNELLEELIVSKYITAASAVSVRATAQANLDWQDSLEGLLTADFVQELVDAIDDETVTTAAPITTTPNTTESISTEDPITTTPSVETTTLGAATIAVSITLLIGAITVTILN